MNRSVRIEHVADTAFWVAYYRSLESKRADALFEDRLSDVLMNDRGKQVAEGMKRVSQYAYWTVTLRTVIIDRLIQDYIKKGVHTVINLGAGLDARPYRLALPKSLKWVEIDFQNVINLKNETLFNEKPQCQLERIGVDMLNKSALDEVLAKIDASGEATLVITEGVIPYLSEEEAAYLAQQLYRQNTVKYWINEYYSPESYHRFNDPRFQSLLGGSPFKFFPTHWFEFFEKSGWIKKELEYLYDVGEQLNRPFPLPRWAKLLKPFIPKERMLSQIRVSAYSVLEKM